MCGGCSVYMFNPETDQALSDSRSQQSIGAAVVVCI